MNDAAGNGPCSCGYPSLTTSTWHVATQIAQGYLYGTINNTDYATAAECGRCIELIRTFFNGNPSRTITFTVVGECGPNDQCGNTTGRNQYMLSNTTFMQIGSAFEMTAGADPAQEMLIAREVPCPFSQGNVIYGQMHFTGGAVDGVTFTGNRYPLQAVQLLQATGNVVLVRGPTNLWQPGPGMAFGASPWTFAITDINGRTVTSAGLVVANNEQSTGVQNPTCP